MSFSLYYALENKAVNRSDRELFTLGCDIYDGPPTALPLPRRLWYKDGELVYSASLLGDSVDLTSFIIAHPILALGVLYPTVLIASEDGTIFYHAYVDNITHPTLLPPGITTIEQAEQQVLELLLGNWTCVVENSLGRKSVTYSFRNSSEVGE